MAYLLSCVQLLATLWTAAYQTLLPMGFSRQEYWSGVPLPSLDFSPSFDYYQQIFHVCLQTSFCMDICMFSIVFGEYLRMK